MSLSSPQKQSSGNEMKSNTDMLQNEKRETPKKGQVKETPQTPNSMKVIIRTTV